MTSASSNTAQKKVLLHLPHSSTSIPDEYQKLFLISGHELEDEMVRVTDWYTDELFRFEDCEQLIFPLSRLLVDPERFRDDNEEVMAKFGVGCIYTVTSQDMPLKVDHGRASLIETYYDPHHARLNQWAKRCLNEHGRCLIIDGHSFPSSPLSYDLDQSADRPDFCIGTDNFHTPSAIVDAAESTIRNANFSVGINQPYSGTMVPSCYLTEDRRVSSIMIEVNRKLYIDEGSAAKSASFNTVQASVASIVGAIVRAWKDDEDRQA